MGLCFLDGVPIGDDGRDASGRTDLPSVRARSRDDAMATILADIDAIGFALNAKLVERAADRYEREPWLLESIAPGLSLASPRRIDAVCRAKLEGLPRTGPRFGDFVQPINLAGAVEFARRQASGFTLQAAE